MKQLLQGEPKSRLQKDIHFERQFFRLGSYLQEEVVLRTEVVEFQVADDGLLAVVNVSP